MSITNASGTTLTESAMNALTSNPPTPPPMRVVTADVYQKFTFDGGKQFEGGKRLLFHAGQVVPQAVIDALFADATVDSISPATGAAAGGTAVVITGTNFGGATAVSFGGVAATQVKVLSETVISCRTGAHAAGAVDVIVTDDSGAVTKTASFTYA